jgi:hypothetical protein
MKYIENNKVGYYIFDELKQMHVKALFSTRKGGVSQGYYSSMNLSYSRGDDPNHVDENYRLFSQGIGVPLSLMFFSDQVHGAKILQVTQSEVNAVQNNEANFKGYDGLVTNLKNLALVTAHADCIPVYFYDPIKEVIGLAHGGWQGSYKEITSKMIKIFTEVYESNVEDIYLSVGPGVCQTCYQVSTDLIEKFKLKFKDESLYGGEDQRYLDLKGIHAYQGRQLGILEEKIHLSNLCTACNESLFYSHRRSSEKRGGHIAVIMMEDPFEKIQS